MEEEKERKLIEIRSGCTVCIDTIAAQCRGVLSGENKEVIAVTKLSDEYTGSAHNSDPEWLVAEQERIARRAAEKAMRVKDPDHRISRKTAKNLARALVVYAD